MELKNIQRVNELKNGTTLCNGKYTISGKLGEGGFGITYKGVQEALDRTVCIKEYFPSGKCVRDTYARAVYPQGISNEIYNKYREAFAKEAKILASFNHRNIVDVLDVFDENNTSYMVMSYIEGRTLQNIVDNKGKIFYPEAINYIGQVTDAIGYIHSHNILHRDIKPDNIMITADNRAILIDFGSARTFEHDKTQIHTSMITHGYAPTEQYTTQSRKGSYTDIYAIGATLYFITTGQAPLEAAARFTEKMSEPQALCPDLPNEINRTIIKAMQLQYENRHQSIKEFMDDLCNKKPSQPIVEKAQQFVNHPPQKPITFSRNPLNYVLIGMFIPIYIAWIAWMKSTFWEESLVWESRIYLPLIILVIIFEILSTIYNKKIKRRYKQGDYVGAVEIAVGSIHSFSLTLIIIFLLIISLYNIYY